MATLGDYIAARVRVALREAFRDVTPELEKLAKESAGGGSSSPFGDVGSLVAFLEGAVIAALGVIAPEAAVPMAAIGAVEGEAGKVGIGVGAGYLLGQIAFPAAQPLLLPLYHASSAAFTNEIFDPSTAAQMAARGITFPSNYVSEGAGGGFDKGHMDALLEASHSWPGLGEMLELVRRGEAAPGDMAQALQRQGMHSEWIPHLQKLTRQLLSPADLALANLRGWLDDPTSHAYAAELGMSSGDFDVLLANTGEPPGLMQLLEMQRRNVLPPGRLERGIRQSRYRDEWIPYIEAIITGPMSVSDAVNAVVQHHLDFDTAKGYAVQNGLDPDHFKTLVENHGRPLSRTEMSSLVHRGKATDQDFLQAMAESDLKDVSDQSGYNYRQGALDLARTLIPARQITTAIQHGALGRADGIAYLMMQGYTQADAGILVDTGLAEHKATLKELTRSDIQALYTDKLITHQEAKAKLVLLGYDDATADELLALADAKHTAALARTLITQVKALYAKGELTREHAIRRLIDGGVVNENARAQVDEWDILHSVPSRTLSEAQTMKAAENGIIDIIEAAQRLVGMGYTRHDATVLLQTAGLVTYDSHIKQGWQPVHPGALFSGDDTQTGGLGGGGGVHLHPPPGGPSPTGDRPAPDNPPGPLN